MDGLAGFNTDEPLYVFSPRHRDWININTRSLEWFAAKYRHAVPNISAETIARWEAGQRVLHRRPGLCVIDDIEKGRRAKVFCCHEIWWEEGADNACQECCEARCGWSYA